VRGLLDSVYRSYPSGAILLWETDEAIPLQEIALTQQSNPYQNTRLLLERLTSLSGIIRGGLSVGDRSYWHIAIALTTLEDDKLAHNVSRIGTKVPLQLVRIQASQ
jgi:hypothetical protein